MLGRCCIGPRPAPARERKKGPTAEGCPWGLAEEETRSVEIEQFRLDHPSNYKTGAITAEKKS